MQSGRGESCSSGPRRKQNGASPSPVHLRPLGWRSAALHAQPGSWFGRARASRRPGGPESRGGFSIPGVPPGPAGQHRTLVDAPPVRRMVETHAGPGQSPCTGPLSPARAAGGPALCLALREPRSDLGSPLGRHGHAAGDQPAHAALADDLQRGVSRRATTPRVDGASILSSGGLDRRGLGRCR